MLHQLPRPPADTHFHVRILTPMMRPLSRITDTYIDADPCPHHSARQTQDQAQR